MQASEDVGGEREDALGLAALGGAHNLTCGALGVHRDDGRAFHEAQPAELFTPVAFVVGVDL